jgi:prolyl 4-hydroxylase
MHYNVITPDERNPLGYKNRKDFYDNYIAGCLKASESDNQLCIWNEEERLEMTLTQPKNMKNFTTAGYAKIKAPPEVTKLLRDYWNDHQEEQAPELWPRGNTYVNHWESQPYVLSMGEEKEIKLSELVRPVIEAWTGQELVSTSVYGIRIYKEGSVLAPHVDRLPLVSSCILNVAQDVDKDWPLEVIGHDGKAANVTAHPGDILFSLS